MSQNRPNSALRIVSLIPSATEIVAGLGLTDSLVGRSHECDFPPQVLNLPICTVPNLARIWILTALVVRFMIE